MEVTKLYAGIFKSLSSDAVLLDLLGFTSTGDADEDLLNKIKKIQKRRKPQDLADNLPMISFYTHSGEYDIQNSDVYYAAFVFDIYTNDEVERAHQIHDRLCELFDGELPSFEGLATLETSHLEAFESVSTLPNTYSFTAVIEFGVALDV